MLLADHQADRRGPLVVREVEIHPVPSRLRKVHILVSFIPGCRFLRFAAWGNQVVPPIRSFAVQHRSFAVVCTTSEIGCLAVAKLADPDREKI